MIRTFAPALPLALLLASVAAPAFAQSEPPEEVLANYGGSSWAFAAGVGSDNRSKDVSKSDGEAYVWGQAEWSSASGAFYAGPSFETIKGSTGSELELELTAGYRPQVWGFDLDLNVAHKWQVDANPGADDQAWEFTADVSRSIGPAAARLRFQHSPDGTGATENWTWVEARIGWDFTDKLTGTAAIGRRDQDAAVDYSGWNIGLTYDLTQDLEFDLRWHDNDAHITTPDERYDSALVAGLNLYF